MNVTHRFMDERGELRVFHWPGYPVIVVLPAEPVTWSTSMEIEVLSGLSLPAIRVHCGPAAPYPVEPTAEEFEAAALEWVEWFHRRHSTLGPLGMYVPDHSGLDTESSARVE